jgi:hypothetical protein
MKTYAIAQWLTDAQKQRIIDAEFEMESGQIAVVGSYGTGCPLGLLFDGASPPAYKVADFLAQDKPETRDVILDAAAEFMSGADNGEITPETLAEALGVRELVGAH